VPIALRSATRTRRTLPLLQPPLKTLQPRRIATSALALPISRSLPQCSAPTSAPRSAIRIRKTLRLLRPLH